MYYFDFFLVAACFTLFIILGYILDYTIHFHEVCVTLSMCSIMGYVHRVAFPSLALPHEWGIQFHSSHSEI